MAANAAGDYVVPTGVGVGHAIFGPNFGKHDYPSPDSIFDLGDGQGPFGATQNAWNWQRLGYGVLDAPDALKQGLADSQTRYSGDPNNGGAGGWQDRWDQWNQTDVPGGGLGGQDLLSAMHQNALRLSQGYGGRDAQGNAMGPAQGQIFNGFTWAQNKLAQNPYLDPTNAMSGYSASMQQSPFAAADPAQYLAAMQGADGRQGMAAIGQGGVQATAGLGQGANFDQYGTRGVADITGLNQGNDFDQYGLRGIDQTNSLARANLAQLTGGIDTEAQNTLANQLPATMQAFEAAGMGRSGAGQLAMMQNQNEILSQANRDKQRVMADYTDREANRQAGAINLATQQGFGGQAQEYGQLAGAMNARAQMGYGGAGQVFGANTGAVNLATQLGGQAQDQYSGLQGQAIMGGLSDRNAANMVGRQGASSLYQQLMDQQSQRYGQDTSNYLAALTNSGQYQNQALSLEAQGQSQAQNDWLNLQANRNQTQQSSLDQYLQLSNANRQIQQDRINQMLQADYMPFDTSMRIATGTTAPAGPQPGNTSFWGGIGGGLAQGVGQAAPSMLSSFWNGNQGPSANVGTPTWQGSY